MLSSVENAVPLFPRLCDVPSSLHKHFNPLPTKKCFPGDCEIYASFGIINEIRKGGSRGRVDVYA